jgi:hypothetical protein
VSELGGNADFDGYDDLGQIDAYVASFDPFTLRLNVDRPEFAPSQSEHSTTTSLLSKVPGWTLVHELAHVFHTCATPMGLSDFLYNFLWERTARDALSITIEIIGETAEVPFDVYEWHKSIGSAELTEAFDKLKALDEALMYRQGGIPVDADSLPPVLQGGVFYDFDGTGRWMVLGTRALYEGYAAALEILRREIERGPMHAEDYPSDEPYMRAYQLFRVRPPSGVHRGSLFEFACFLDTIFLACGDIATGQHEYGNPSQAFNTMMATLYAHDDLEL